MWLATTWLKQTGFLLSFYREWSKSLPFSLKIPCKAKVDPTTNRPSLFYWSIGFMWKFCDLRYSG